MTGDVVNKKINSIFFCDFHKQNISEITATLFNDTNSKLRLFKQYNQVFNVKG